MAKQKLRFAQLYRDNRKAVEDALTAMWCGETKNASQKAYVEQLRKIIRNIFAPESAVPLVQCLNSYEEAKDPEAAKALLKGLWTMPYNPYEHQYQCWNTLLNERTADGKRKSIVVTTGTGSGKTECFMMPLVRDLIDVGVNGHVQAIFLYPLNALMEDQKARMEDLLAGTNLTYAVYNSDLPEKELPRTATDFEKVRRKIDSIKGITRNEQGEIVEVKFQHAIGTREELRKHPANILLTNPTMLEYILLRGKDSSLIDPDAHSLRWIAIDETHTYTGAGAAEIAMLLRRVLMAFDVEAKDIRFATSSATIGSGDELRHFIADLTGLELEQVRAIDGVRRGIDSIPNDEYEPIWRKLINENTDGFITLNDLMGKEGTIEEKLARLDDMCQKAEDANLSDLRVKVHYFYRVPNHGLFVDISQHQGGSFRIYTENLPDAGRDGSAPLLEMSRCKHCGEYLAVAEVNYSDSTFQPITMDDSDMFDLEDEEANQNKLLIFGLSNEDVHAGDNNAPFIIRGNHVTEYAGIGSNVHDWHVIANTQCSCPYCGTKLTKRSRADEENPDIILPDEQDAKKLQKFRVAPDFVSRLIAPSTLSLMTEAKPKDPNRIALHKGQQYISFVDSRLKAAETTISQNIEEEKQWVYATIFHELCRRQAHGMTIEQAYNTQQEALNNAQTFDEKKRINKIMSNLLSDDEAVAQQQLEQLKGVTYLSWKDIASLLRADKLFDTFCLQFAERSEQSEETTINGKLTEAVKKKYVQSIMVQLLAKRPLSAAAPETLGIFTSYYPALENVLKNPLPQAVLDFNQLLGEPQQLSQKDWLDLMRIFLDYTVRSNESVYLKLADNDTMDIFQCVRFATQKERRRSVRKPQIKDKQANQSRIIRMLAKLVADSKNLEVRDAIRGYKEAIQKVIDAMWQDLTETYAMLTHSTHYDKEVGAHVKDKGIVEDDVQITPYRLNLTSLAFKLYEDVYLCDTNVSKDSRHVQVLRPIETLFKSFSPYIISGVPQTVNPELREHWITFPFYKESGNEPGLNEIHNWAKEHRKLLWNHNLWGENGTFTDRLDKVYCFPELFIQAEHTAQVDKMVSRIVQADFKDHAINILACSTTMEMGVDLGDLELVMLTSVPPQPSNYKQRAGRSGRREQVRSVCVTLCGSDAIGLRTLYNPMDNVILRKMSTPTVDLTSVQVIQRHVNSFLVREFGVFQLDEGGGSITQKAIDYYTNFKLEREGSSNRVTIKRKIDNAPVGPAEGLGDPTGTPYEMFNEQCTKPLTPELRSKLDRLLEGIMVRSDVRDYVEFARRDNEQCYINLELRIADLKLAYQQAKSEKQQAFFMLKYIEPLATQLLNFWATNRFTPNANMPVNVVEFDINTTNTKYYTATTTSNPSYPLRTALSQYAPGNSIPRDGMVRIVRGIRYTNFFNPMVTFKTLYHDKEQVVIDIENEIPEKLKWSVSGTTDLELLQPTEFIPDMNESASRILERNTYTRVSAQLIGTDEWSLDRTEPHLFSARSGREGSNAKILYYNEGIGYGYCHCTKCGRTVLESAAASGRHNLDYLPHDMNPVHPDDEEQPNYHYSLVKRNNTPSRCLGCNQDDSIHRNVVLGDTIPTDYTEIRIRHVNKDWINTRNGHEELLTTLGILFTQALATELNVERGDIDFTVTPNGHICIFDTNPGGSGYSSQLAEMDLLKKVIRLAMDIIEVAEATQSKDALIDRYTLHYINKIDIAIAKDWINEEWNAQKVLPLPIRRTFTKAEPTETSLRKLYHAFEESAQPAFVFVNNDFGNWDFNDVEYGWCYQHLPRFMNHIQNLTFCIAETGQAAMEIPIKNMVNILQNIAKDVVAISNPYIGEKLYPLAYIDGYLYFTNDAEKSSLNSQWGNATMYRVKTENPALKGKHVHCEQSPSTKIFMLEGQNDLKISTKGLGKLITEKASGIIEQFYAHCKSCDEPLRISYQDEHLKSVLSMVLTMQTIEFFVRKIGKDFSLKFLIEKYNDGTDRNNVRANLRDYPQRDQYLSDLSRLWIDDLNESQDIDFTGAIAPIESFERRSLTHWRELSIVCGKKKLSIFPDGGFMDGWIVDSDANSRKYFNDNTTTRDTVWLVRTQDIKYDVAIEDVE